MKLYFAKVFSDVRAAFMSKSKEPRRNGAMPTLTYYEVLPSQRPRSCCISRRGRRLDLLKRFKHSKATPHYSRIQHIEPHAGRDLRELCFLRL